METIADTPQLAEIGWAAQRLELSSTRVRDLIAAGRIPAIRTVRGQHLLRVADVERLAREREAARLARA